VEMEGGDRQALYAGSWRGRVSCPAGSSRNEVRSQCPGELAGGAAGRVKVLPSVAAVKRFDGA
jgi:hypothetical protein